MEQEERLFTPPFITVCVTIFFMYTSLNMTNLLIPLFASANGASLTEIGLIIFSNLVLASVFSAPLGVISDKFGRKKIIILGCTLGGVSSLLLILTSTPLTILAAFAVGGLGHAAYGPTLAAAAGDVSSLKTRVRAYAVSDVARSAAMPFGPVLSGFLIGSIGYQSTFLISGVLAVAAAVMILMGRFESSKQVWSPPKEKIKTFSLLGDPRLLAVMFASFSVIFTSSPYRSFIPLYATGLGIPLTSIGLILAAQAVFSVFIRLPVGRYSDRYQRRAPFASAGILLTATASALLASFGDVYSLLGFSILLGAAFGTAQVMLISIVSTLSTERNRGVVMGLFTTFIYAGSGIGAAVMGPTIQQYGYDTGFKAASLCALAGFVIFAFTSWKKKIV